MFRGNNSQRGGWVAATVKWATTMKRQKRTCQGGEDLHSPDHGPKATKSAREREAQQHEGGKVSKEATVPVPVPEVGRGQEQGKARGGGWEGEQEGETPQ